MSETFFFQTRGEPLITYFIKSLKISADGFLHNFIDGSFNDFVINYLWFIRRENYLSRGVFNLTSRMDTGHSSFRLNTTPSRGELSFRATNNSGTRKHANIIVPNTGRLRKYAIAANNRASHCETPRLQVISRSTSRALYYDKNYLCALRF